MGELHKLAERAHALVSHIDSRAFHLDASLEQIATSTAALYAKYATPQVQGDVHKVRTNCAKAMVSALSSCSSALSLGVLNWLDF